MRTEGEMTKVESGKQPTGAILARSVFLDGKEIAMRVPPPAGLEYKMLADLHFAVACYLSSDGSFGLYDSGTAIKARDEIMRIVSREAIAAIQESIRSKAKSGGASET